MALARAINLNCPFDTSTVNFQGNKINLALKGFAQGCFGEEYGILRKAFTA